MKKILILQGKFGTNQKVFAAQIKEKLLGRVETTLAKIFFMSISRRGPQKISPRMTMGARKRTYLLSPLFQSFI